ncbi:MAG TPA: HAMP domain-containing sensor histidine kinase [Pirellulales bacterium]|jgi:signal transduction histidine kinase|nr:HAMP domain-containing sensor histidine kinase [Pirellulales bacterium]
MRLALKLVLAFLLANIVLAVVYGYLAVQHEVRVFERTASDEAKSLGPPMEHLLVAAWHSSGDRGLHDFIREASTRRDQQMRIRWVWFDVQPGDPDSPIASLDQLTATVFEQHQTVEQSASGGNELLLVYWPVQLAVERRGGLEFSEPAAELESNKREIIFQTVLLVAGMAIISGLLATYLGVRMIGEPMRDLIAKTRRVAAGDLEGPVNLRSHDELAELGESLNLMCSRLADSQTKIREETAARIAAIEQLRHTDRLNTVGRLAAGIAHELGTPLNVVAGRAGLILSGRLAQSEIGPSAAAIKTEADRMTKIIRQLLDFARAGTPRKAAVDLRSVVSQTIDLLRGLADEQQVQICFAPSNEPELAEVDAEQIQQVLTNLVVNAIQAMPEGGKVEIGVDRRAARAPEELPGGLSPFEAGAVGALVAEKKGTVPFAASSSRPGVYYCIEVRDSGVGISPEHRQHLFEPFFTTKDVGEGTGLGLSIAYGIVREHGGWIDVASEPGKGSCFSVYLPAETKT